MEAGPRTLSAYHGPKRCRRRIVAIRKYFDHSHVGISVRAWVPLSFVTQTRVILRIHTRHRQQQQQQQNNITSHRINITALIWKREVRHKIGWEKY